MSEVDQNPMFLPPGTRLEEFEIDRVLGSGGFGITYLAHDTRLGRKVVIKENFPLHCCSRNTDSRIVHPRTSSDVDVEDFEAMRVRFEREAEIVASLDHPGIVRILRSFESYGTAYFVMPFVEGDALDEVLKQRNARNEPYSEAELRELLGQVLDALLHLHAKSIYHRDIKPGNILMTREKGPVLIDFGAARQITSERSMTMMESAGYTPFEQMQSNGRIGPWSDVYALAATMIRLMTGERPISANDRLPEDPWIPLAQRGELTARFSLPFLSAIDRAFASLPQNRWQSAQEWLDVIHGSSPVPPPLPAPKPRHGGEVGRLIFPTQPVPTSPPPPRATSPVPRSPTASTAFPGPPPPAPGASQPAKQTPQTSPEELEAQRVERDCKRRVAMKKFRKLMTQMGVFFSVIILCGVGFYFAMTSQSNVNVDPDRVAENVRAAELQAIEAARTSQTPPASEPPEVSQPLDPLPPVAPIEFNPDRPISWEPAANAGCMKAAEALGLAYLRGHSGFERAPVLGIDYLRKAASPNQVEATLALAMELESGRYVPKDYPLALRHYETAAAQGNITARLNLGIMHAQGRGTPQNDQLAVYHYRLAADKEDRDAQYLLGMMYEFGLGPIRDLETAKGWYEKSAAQGDHDAIQRMKAFENP